MDEMHELLSLCVKCGQCRSICPVFREVQREPAVARGKMALLEAALHSHGGLDRGLSDSLSLCLLCGTCSATCPNGAEAHEAIRQARSILARNEGLPLPKRILSKWTLSDRSFRDRVLRGASALQDILTSELSEDRGLRFRLPFRRLHNGWVPRLARPFFLERTPEAVRASAPRRKVGLFVGCAIHYLAPQVGDATVGLLNKLGLTLIIPKEQGCCGLMAHGMGDEGTARRLAIKTLQAFQDHELEAIIAPCASCAAHLKLGFPLVLQQTVAEHQASQAFSSKVWELSSFLVQQGVSQDMREGTEEMPKEVITYHDPCHLVRHMDITEEPRTLLRSLPSAIFQEMEGADQCCGMGGSFRLTHPGISRSILNKKTDAISRSGAHEVVTGCMGCWIQLQEGLHARSLDVKVTHLAECLWKHIHHFS